MLRMRIVFIATLFIAAIGHAQNTFHRTFNVAPGGTLTLDADVGDVRVNPGGAGVMVDVQRGTRELEVNFNQSGNDVTVTAKYEGTRKWFNWNNYRSPLFVVTVPSNYNLHLTTSGGDVRVGDLNGEVRVRTSGGDLEVGRVTRAVEARTSGGSIRIDDAASIQARTSGGSIEVHHVAGELYAHTSGGGIAIDDAEGAIDAEASGGSIRARFSRPPRSDSKLSTSGGGISISLASNVALDVDAHSSGGGVESDVPITVLGKQGEDSLTGKINGGGPKLVLRSSGGGIHLKRL